MNIIISDEKAILKSMNRLDESSFWAVVIFLIIAFSLGYLMGKDFLESELINCQQHSDLMQCAEIYGLTKTEGK